MLNYLKIFSKLLFLFGVVGSIGVALGFAPRMGSVPDILGILGLQVLVGGLILYTFKLEKIGKLDRKKLQYAGWSLVVLLIIVCQIWINIANIKM